MLTPVAGHRTEPRRLRLPLLLMLTAAGAGASALGHTMSLGSAPAPAPAQPSQFGTAIERGIAARDRELARRTQAAELRERSLRAAEQRFAAEPPAGAPAANPARPEDSRTPPPPPIMNLARIYQAMKPARAAVIFAALQPQLQVDVARAMRERSVAQLMANMEPAAAARLSMMLAGRGDTMAQPTPARPRMASLPRTARPGRSPGAMR